MARPGVFGRPWLILVAVLALETIGVLAFGTRGARLRAFVDLVSLQGLALALAGAFLVADRPFLAARAMARHDEPPAPPAAPIRNRRAWGYWALATGAGLFGFAALLWAVRGNLRSLVT